MKRMTNRQLQAIQTKNKLMEVSMELIRKHGFDAVTIQQICEETGVSTGAFYHHLKSKAGIVVEAYTQCDDYFEEVVSHQLSGMSYNEQILEYIGNQMDYAENIGVDLMIQIYKAQITEGNQFFLSEERGLTKGLFHLVELAQKNKELSSHVSYKQIGKEILIVSRGIIYNWCQSEGSYKPAPMAKNMVRNYLSAYKI
jgi:TetR/AcrR family transcriptional regulator, fatty acid metabolism regulator protein